MTFHRGQGGNLAIKDAQEFITAIENFQNGDVTLAEALDQYDKGVVARGEEVAISKKQSEAFHDFQAMLNSPVVKMGVKPAN
jgi:2-polyprenyl-6-methoxyphenol hydroxylase-like FAD-dependent oxidoreductase